MKTLQLIVLGLFVAATIAVNCGSASTCGAGQYCSSTSGTGTCTNCGTGKYRTAPAAGTAIGSNEAASVCTSCPAGSYNDQTAVASCTSCPDGTSVTGTGSDAESDCTTCEDGLYSETVEGLTTCFDTCESSETADEADHTRCAADYECIRAGESGSYTFTCTECGDGLAREQTSTDGCVASSSIISFSLMFIAILAALLF